MKRLSVVLLLLISILSLSACIDTPVSSTVQQNVIADPNNSSTTNIAAGSNFTGTATSTLGIADIQVSLKTDRNMTVYVQQSPDGTHWDIQDHYDYIYSLGGDSWDTKAVNSYYRVIVVNVNGGATSYFRLQSAMLPIGEPLPRSLSDTARLKTQTTITDEYGFEAENTPFNELRTAQSVKLAGGIFIGTIVDPNFWTVNTTANGSAYQDVRTATTGGELTLSTNTTANGAARIASQRRGRFVAGNSNYYKSVIHLPDSGTANNVRRWGLADYTTITSLTDGAYFQLSGTTFSVVTMRGGTANVTSSGSFNGNYGSMHSVDPNNSHTYEIYYSPYSVYFVIDGILLHTITISASPWTNSVNLYVYCDDVNSGGSVSNVIMHVRAASIHRLGPTYSAPKYVNISTGNTTVLKYSAGTLQTVTLNNPTNITITIYDNTVASGNVIAVIAPQPNSPPVTLTYGIDFSTGLTITTTGAINMTVVYE